MKITMTFDSVEEMNAWRVVPHVNGSPKTTLQRISMLSRRTLLALAAENIKYLEEAESITDAQLLMFGNFGRHTLRELREVLSLDESYFESKRQI